MAPVGALTTVSMSYHNAENATANVSRRQPALATTSETDGQRVAWVKKRSLIMDRDHATRDKRPIHRPGDTRTPLWRVSCRSFSSEYIGSPIR